MLRVRAICPTTADRLREQRPDDDLGAFVERLFRGRPRAVRRAGIVLHQQLNAGVGVKFRERHLRRVAHRLTGEAGIAGRRQRQNERNLDLAGTERCLRPGGAPGGEDNDGSEEK